MAEDAGKPQLSPTAMSVADTVGLPSHPLNNSFRNISTCHHKVSVVQTILNEPEKRQRHSEIVPTHLDMAPMRQYLEVFVEHGTFRYFVLAELLKMRRAGREPAEDVKRRLIAACAEIGQEATALMQLVGDERIVMVNTPTVALMARVPTSGTWPTTIDVRCGTSDNVCDPWMQGRSQVPFEELDGALRDTLDERAKVIAAMRLGIEGPYRFERSVWAIPSLLS